MKNTILVALSLVLSSAAFAGNGQVGSVGKKTITIEMPAAFSYERLVGNSDGSISVVLPKATVDGEVLEFAGSASAASYICEAMNLKMDSFERRHNKTDDYFIVEKREIYIEENNRVQKMRVYKSPASVGVVRCS